MSLPPLVEPAAELTRQEVMRYSRHLIIPDVAMDGQKRLKNAKVLAVGAGGLGSPTLMYLAAAGVGTLGIIDFDTVDESNLQRQVIHGQSDIGRPKAESARASVLEINPHHPVVERLTRESDPALFADWSQILFDQAVLAEGGELDDPAGFVKRLNKLTLALAGGPASKIWTPGN